MNSENVESEPSLQMHKPSSVLFFFLDGAGGGGGGRVHFFVFGGRVRGGRGRVVHSAQGTTQFVDHKLTRIIQKELQLLIKYFVSS